MADPNGVLIIAELAEGKVASVTAELATIGAQLAKSLGQELSVIVAAHKVATSAGEASHLGVSKVYTVENSLLAGFQIEAHLVALAAAIKQINPRIILVARSVIGRDLGPRLAFRLGVGIAQDTVDLSWDAGHHALVATRPVYGGASMAKVAVKSVPAVATVRPKVFDPIANSAPGQIVPLTVSIDPKSVMTKVLSQQKQAATGIKLEEARIVIGGGRGLGGPEPFKVLDEVAKELKAAVGASRAACDAGWVPHTYQIGLTGKSISADLYITVGISGASQHLAGISTVKNVVAINKDADANIFKEARYGVVGDWNKVLPAFLTAVRELNSNR
ncbi:MAG: electron transfer flavoprotein subunit alpha/FixB family protein [Dehalococcoidia bacterium]|nr:electron transfer flavoprotein subunit alpha/FixB family protein [Dehalococcoidia bacterium]